MDGLGLAGARHAKRVEDQLRQVIADQRSEIEALARAKNAAEAANEAKTRFLSSISHEIRSPLNSIYGYAQLLERRNGAGALKAAKVIRCSSEHLSNLIEGLLDISQVESGSLKLSRDTIRFRAFLVQVIDMLELQASAKGLALGLDCPVGLPEFVRTDAKRLRQVLINLLSNAIKFTESGSVTLKVHYRNELASFEVIDTGIGIPAEDLERIFAPFERGQGAAPDQPGVGLGLAITGALVQIMGGDLRVTSEPGKGSRFIVRLMLSKPMVPPAEPPVTKALNNYLGHKRTVLVVDDDAAHRAMLKGLLEPQGFRVLTAAGGKQALMRANEAQPDLVLLDVQLGSDNGWDIAKHLRKHHSTGLRIVMLSGETPGSDALTNDGSANDLFVTKPFNFDALLDVVAQQLSLEWQGGSAKVKPPGEGAGGGLPAPLAAQARPHLARIDELVRIGHVRGIEEEIDRIAGLGPGTAGLVEEMRSHLDAFDLAALAQSSEGAQQR
jgi:nitrogen-specific signal transduction histidine kinase/CheY-like chemotaxis protein